jgi:hypothetical protein
LKELKASKALSDRARSELFRYFPIAFVAALEGYFGHVYRDLINAGPPYIGRAAQFKDFKFGIEPILTIHGRFITAGELVAHLLPHNSLADVEANLTVLLGEKYKTALGREKYVPTDGPPAIPVSEFLPGMLSRVSAAFRFRHIFCHELATKVKVSPRTIFDVCQACNVLVIITEPLIMRLLKEDQGATET